MKLKQWFILIPVLFIFGILNSQAKEVILALSSSPANLSPFFSTDGNSQNINRLVHMTLTDFNSKMKFECRLCETFSESIIKNRHHIKFKLRSDIKFWDGSTVKAQDVKNTWKYFAKDKKIKSIFRFAFSSIKNVIVHNETEVEIIFEKFDLDNLSNLNLFKIIKLNKLDENGYVEEKPSLTEIIGAGPYRFGKTSALEIELIPTNPKRAKFIFKVVKDETTLALKILNKEVDLSLANISPRKYEWLKKSKNKGLSFWEKPSTNFIYMGINHRKPELKDVRVRKALSHLIPRLDLMNYKFKNTVQLSSSMFSSAFNGLYLGEKFDKRSPELAKKLFNEAGFKKGKSGYLEKNGKVFEIDWKVSSNKAILETVETIKGYFEKAGIKVTTTVQEWGTFMRGIKTGQFDITIGRWMGFTGPGMLKYVFHSKSLPPKGANRGYYVNKEFDSLLDLATTELNEEKRNFYYKKALKLANNDYSYINLWHPNVIWAGRDCIKNLEIQSNGSFLPLLKLESHCGR